MMLYLIKICEACEAKCRRIRNARIGGDGVGTRTRSLVSSGENVKSLDGWRGDGRGLRGYYWVVFSDVYALNMYHTCTHSRRKGQVHVCDACSLNPKPCSSMFLPYMLVHTGAQHCAHLRNVKRAARERA